MEAKVKESPNPGEWFEAYRVHVLENGAPPASVYAFCRQVGIAEEEFFDRYPSLEALEQEIWAERIHQVVSTLEADAEYPGYPPRQKTLAFFYTFLEAIKGQRSWYLARFPRSIPGQEPAVLSKFHEAFRRWAEPIAKELSPDPKILKKLRPEALFARAGYLHFRTVIKHYLEDDSQGFERTDAYIEKSTRLLFDLVETNVADSALDLARFLAGKRS